MGLFDFVKKIGNKLFSRDEEAGEKIKKHIESNNPGITELGVNFSKGVVSLSGQAASPEAMEKALLMAGNANPTPGLRIAVLTQTRSWPKSCILRATSSHADIRAALSRQSAKEVVME
jgi:hypothetical protein